MPSCSQVRRCVICSGSHPARKRQVPTMCTGGNRNTPAATGGHHDHDSRRDTGMDFGPQKSVGYSSTGYGCKF